MTDKGPDARRRSATRGHALLLATAAAIAATPAAAQQAPVPPPADATPVPADQQTGPDAKGISDIVVTARRREEKTQDVPAALTAFGQTDIAARSMVDLTDAQKSVPNLSIQSTGSASGSGSNVGIFIRGVGQDDFVITADPGVGLYLDGVYLGRSVGSVLSLKDVASLEVLRGPQGTLFGRNTVGGAVLIDTKKPSRTFEGYVEGTYGSDNLAEITSRIEGPIGPDVSAAITGSYRRRDGYGRSLNNDVDYGNEDKLFGRLQVRATPTERLTLDLSADYSRQRQNPVVSAYVAQVPGAAVSLVDAYNQFAPVRGLPLITSADLSSISDPFTSRKLLPGRDDYDVWGTALTGAYDVGGGMQVKSITAYRNLKVRIADDIDGISQRLAESTIAIDQWQFSEELQFNGKSGGLTWASGLYFYKEDARQKEYDDVLDGTFDFVEALPFALQPAVPTLPPTPCSAFTPAQLSQGLSVNLGPATVPLLGCRGNSSNYIVDNQTLRDVRVRVDNYAAYAHLTYDVTPALNLALGGRISYERKRFDVTSTRVAASAARGFPVYEVPFTPKEASFTRFTPFVGVNYKPARDVLLFASYSRGFKSGTFNGRGNSATAVNDVVKPETLDAFEIGWKSEFLDRRVRFNGSVFHSIYKDIQLAAFPPAITVVQDFINAGKATITGVETELTVKPIPALQLGGTGSFADARIKEIDPAAAAVTGVEVGNRLKKTPKWSYSLFGQYDLDLRGSGTVAFRVDWSWRGSVYHDAANNPLTLEGSYGLLDARIGYTAPGARWSLAAWGRNLTNRTYFGSLFQTPGATVEAYPHRGREFGATAKVAFR